MKPISRHIFALVLIAVYLTIVMSPLAPLALHSPAVAHALTGECAEDCRICGCSPERSAARTCCCWQKKLKREEAKKQQVAQKDDCCKKKKGRTLRPTISECPCGSGKLIAFAGTDKDELLPYHFSGLLCSRQRAICAQNPPKRLANRHGAPPDPPPKLV